MNLHSPYMCNGCTIDSVILWSTDQLFNFHEDPEGNSLQIKSQQPKWIPGLQTSASCLTIRAKSDNDVVEIYLRYKHVIANAILSYLNVLTQILAAFKQIEWICHNLFSCLLASSDLFYFSGLSL